MRSLNVEPFEYDFFVKNEAIPELLHLKSLPLANLDLGRSAFCKVEVGAELYRERAVLFNLLRFLKFLIIEGEAVKERDLSSCIEERVLRVMEQLSGLLYGILRVVENSAVEDLGLIHRDDQDGVASLP